MFVKIHTAALRTFVEVRNSNQKSESELTDFFNWVRRVMLLEFVCGQPVLMTD